MKPQQGFLRSIGQFLFFTSSYECILQSRDNLKSHCISVLHVCYSTQRSGHSMYVCVYVLWRYYTQAFSNRPQMTHCKVPFDTPEIIGTVYSWWIYVFQSNCMLVLDVSTKMLMRKLSCSNVVVTVYVNFIGEWCLQHLANFRDQL